MSPRPTKVAVLVHDQRGVLREVRYRPASLMESATGRVGFLSVQIGDMPAGWSATVPLPQHVAPPAPPADLVDTARAVVVAYLEGEAAKPTLRVAMDALARTLVTSGQPDRGEEIGG